MLLTIDEINDIKYEIIESDNCKYVYLSQDPCNESVLGMCDPSTTTIYLYEHLTFTKKIKVLRHELAHAIIFECMARKDTYTEEDVCDFMSNYGVKIDELVKEYIERYV